MYEIMTGAIFEEDPKSFPSKIAQLNTKGYPGKVHELYGSMRSSKIALPTSRPDFRLPDITDAYLIDYVKACHDNGLIFNYTMNANFIGNLEDISNKYEDIVNALKFLENEVKVDRITVAHPILLDIVCKHTSIPIEVSTVLNVNSLQAPRELKKR